VSSTASVPDFASPGSEFSLLLAHHTGPSGRSATAVEIDHLDSLLRCSRAGAAPAVLAMSAAAGVLTCSSIPEPTCRPGAVGSWWSPRPSGRAGGGGGVRVPVRGVLASP